MNTGRMPLIILHLWSFLYISDAGCRGNKITDVGDKNSKTVHNMYVNCAG